MILVEFLLKDLQKTLFPIAAGKFRYFGKNKGKNKRNLASILSEIFVRICSKYQFLCPKFIVRNSNIGNFL